jgi:hypothetical protein
VLQEREQEGKPSFVQPLALCGSFLGGKNGNKKTGLADYKFITLVPIPILGETYLLILLFQLVSGILN